MYLEALWTQQFRNLEVEEFIPDRERNVIYGENAQGKTNLLDAIWYPTGCQSFHGVKPSHLPRHGCKEFSVKARFHDGERSQEIEYGYQEKRRHILINGVSYSHTGSLLERYHCVGFSPQDIGLISGEPRVRRDFLDLCACQISPKQLRTITAFQKLLRERNVCLSQERARSMLPIVTEKLAEQGAKLSLLRFNQVKRLDPIASDLYSQMTRGREKLTLHYRGMLREELERGATLEELVACYQERLEENKVRDCELGYTARGSQRDDLQMEINGSNVHCYGSQGQRKSTALVLRLSQAIGYQEKWRESPIILLDDVLGELDEQRQRIVTTLTEGMQVFITLCHRSSLPFVGGAMFLMQQGALKKTTYH